MNRRTNSQHSFTYVYRYDYIKVSKLSMSLTLQRWLTTSTWIK